jgi:hypothetical protein
MPSSGLADRDVSGDAIFRTWPGRTGRRTYEVPLGVEPGSLEEEFRRFVDDYRAQCLWFLREDYYPETPPERERVLALIAKHGDQQAFLRAARVGTGLRERSGYVEAMVSLHDQELVLEWTRDSAFRFFPLVEDDDLGLTLHPFDLATNKVLALVRRLEARDWIDVIACHERLQPLGYVAWAACGKDPGVTPSGILEQARRSSRYTDAEVSSLAFDGPTPRAAELSRRWHEALQMADAIIARLPAAHVGDAVLASDGRLLTGGPSDLERVLAEDGVRFHKGRIGGAWPQVKA